MGHRHVLLQKFSIWGLFSSIGGAFAFANFYLKVQVIDSTLLSHNKEKDRHDRGGEQRMAYRQTNKQTNRQNFTAVSPNEWLEFDL